MVLHLFWKEENEAVAKGSFWEWRGPFFGETKAKEQEVSLQGHVFRSDEPPIKGHSDSKIWLRHISK